MCAHGLKIFRINLFVEDLKNAEKPFRYTETILKIHRSAILQYFVFVLMQRCRIGLSENVSVKMTLLFGHLRGFLNGFLEGYRLLAIPYKKANFCVL
jgi:hypothetical protein